MRASLHIPIQFNAAQFYVDRHLDEGRGGKTAILHGNEKLNYRQVAESVNRAANAMRRTGIRRKDRVLLLLFDSPAFVAAFWGAIKIGAVPVPINTSLTAEEFLFTIEDSGARGLIIEGALFEKVALLLRTANRFKNIWIASARLEGFASFDKDLVESSSESSAAKTGRDDPAFWLYTSGSTGRPKASIHCHRDMVCCLETYGKRVLGIRPEDVTFSTSKLFFAYGLGNALHFPFGVGAASVLLAEKPTPGKVVETLGRFRPTIFFAVPSVYAALLQAQEIGAGDFRSVRCAVSAGEALPAPLWERCRERFGISIIDGIGSTEMLHMFISNRPGAIVPGSSGQPVPGYKVKIVDEHLRKVGKEKVGDLWVKGASAAAGYWRRPALTRSTFRGQWTVTGDKFYRDARGVYWHCGRSDDMLKVSGMWVSPVEIESALLAHPGVLECAVVGAKDSDELIKPQAFVVLKDPGQSPTEADLLQFLRKSLPGFKAPRWIVFCASLPRTATGKVQRFKLRVDKPARSETPLQMP
jgi:benzoate-CoA ligase family protein